jgi:RHS repeat-associated protein
VVNDETAPTAMVSVPATSGLGIPVSWAGSDTESGIRHYEVEVKEAGGSWTDWLTETTASQGTFIGTIGMTYTFQVRATDNVDNVSGWVESDEVGVYSVKKYYAFGGSKVAMRQGDVVYYLSGDHLGSTSLTTDDTGTPISEVRYLPYGEERWTSGATPTDFTFTGQRNEAGFGLMDYNARYYSARLGRFISPDSIVPELEMPQAWNRYSYVYNNPLRYTDPTGHLSEDEVKEYFGFEDEDEMKEAFGEAVTNQLWDTDFTWGDVLDYDGGSAMLVLYETGEGTGIYEGGFLGIGGDHNANRVSSGILRQSEDVEFNPDLTEKYKDSYENLPKIWMDNQGRYNHVTTTYVDIATLNEVFFWGQGVSPAVEAYYFIRGMPIPPQLRAAVFTFSAGSFLAGVIDRTSGGYLIQGEHIDYPVVRPSRPAGYAKTTLHTEGPIGAGGN